jgi:FKBP-type peptidyl-prolyl cis-trans isomerase
MTSAKTAVCLVVAGLGASCAGASFPRETRANNARSDDPWLEGARCSADAGGSSDLRIEDLAAGTGRPVERGETVRVHYVAALPSGATLHDSRDQGVPSEIIIGSTKTICGFEKALIGMSAGGQRRVFVPWNLAFGEDGRAPDVQPRTDLVFVIDLYLPADVVFQPGAPPAPPMGPAQQPRVRGR